MMMISIHFRLPQLYGQRWQETLLHWVERPKESYLVALPLSIEMSIAILEETLDPARRRTLGNLDYTCHEHFLPIQSLIDELTACAWCPSEVSLILAWLDDTSAFFASRLDRQELKADHAKCSPNKCQAFNLIYYRVVQVTDNFYTSLTERGPLINSISGFTLRFGSETVKKSNLHQIRQENLYPHSRTLWEELPR